MTSKAGSFRQVMTNPRQAIRDMSLRPKLMLIALAIVAFGMGGLTLLSVSRYTTAMTDQVGAGLVAVAETQGQNLGTILAQRVRSMQVSAANPEALEAITAQNATYTGTPGEIGAELLRLDEQWVAAGDDDPLVKKHLNSDLASELDKITSVIGDFAEAFVTDRYGGLVAASDRTSDYYQADEDWWQAAYNNGEGGIFIAKPELDESSSVVGIDMAVPVYGPNGEIVGVLRTTLDATTLLTEFQVELGKTGGVDLFLPAGGIFAPGEEHAPGESTHGIDSATLAQLNAAPEGYIDAVYDEVPSVVASGDVISVNGEDFISGLGWQITVHQARSEALADVQQVNRAAWVILGAIVVVSMGAAVFAAQIVTNPILKLTDAVTRFAAGDHSVRTESKARDEIGTLASSFSTLANEVDALMTDIQARSEALAERTRELEATQRVTFAASERVTPDELLDLVVNLIRDQFDLYHAQVYLVDEEQQAAVLKQSTGYAGRQLLTRKHHIPLDATSLVTKAIHSGEPVLVEDTTKDPNFMANPLLPETRSELVVPLKLKEQIIGALDAQDKTPGRFGPSTTALFQSMADQVAILFENSELLQRITDQTESLTVFTGQLRTAAEIARRMGTVLDPEQLLEQTVELLQSRFGLYHVHVYVVDETTNRLMMRAGSGEVGRVLRKQHHAIPLDAAKSLVARAARGEQVVLVNDTSLESDFMPNPLLPQTRAEVSIPLVAGEKVLGVLDIQDDQPNRFSEADVDTFGTLAGQIATALQTAGLFEQTRLRLQVSRALATAQTEDEVLDVLIDQLSLYPQAAANVMALEQDAETGTFFLVTRRFAAFDSGVLETPLGSRFPVDPSMDVDAVTLDKPVVYSNIFSEPADETSRLAAEQFGYVSSVSMRLSTGDVIVAASKQEGFFDERKLSLYKTLAEQGATALRIARLNDSVQRSLQEAQVRLKASQALATAQTEEDVLDVLIQQMEIYPNTRPTIYMVVPEAEELTIAVRRQAQYQCALPLLPEGMSAPISQFPMLKDTAEGKPFITSNLLEDEVVGDPATREIARQMGIHSVISQPLVAGGQFLGIISVSSPEVGYFDEEKLHLYQTLAEQGATALQIARLNDSVQRSLQETQVRLEVSQALAGAQTEEDVLDVLVQKAGLYPKAQAMLFMNEQEGEEIYVVARRIESFDSGLPSILPPGTRFPASQFKIIAQHETASGEFVSPNVLTDERVDPVARQMSQQMGTVSMAIVPIGVGDEQLGSLSFSAKEEGYFDEQKLNLYRTLAEQGATALQIARLNDEVERSLTELDQIFSAAPDGMRVIDPDFNVLRANEALATMCGVGQDEAIGMKCYETFGGAFCNTANCTVARILAGEERVEAEANKERNDGSLIPCVVSATPLRRPDGTIVGIVEILKDVTEQKLAQEEMQKLATVVRHSSELVNLATLEGQMTFVNEAGSRMLGIDPDEAAQYAIPHVIPEELMPMVQSELLPTLMNEGAWEGELQYKSVKTGELTDVYASTFLITDPESGAPLYLANVSRDITEQKRAEQQIAVFKALAENATDAVGMADLEGLLIYANRALYQQMGYDYGRQEMIGLPLVAIWPEEDLPTMTKQVLPQVMAGGWSGESRQKRRDGSVFDTQVSAFPVLGERSQPLCIAAILRDITEQKQAQAERERFTTQLRTAADLAEQVNAILDPDRLLPEVVNGLQKRFGLYHVHVYTLAEPTPEQLDNADNAEVTRLMRERPLVLRAGSGEVGRQLLAQGHTIPLHTEKSLVARAARDRAPVLVNNTAQAPDFMPNPLLPETRSEVAVPLAAGDKVLGVLDVQDNQPDRFTQSDIDVLVTMAGQIATALQNAGYFEEVQRTAERLKEVDRLKSEFLASMSHELRTPLNSIIGYTEIMLMGLDAELDPEMKEDVQAIYDNGQHLLRIINDVLDLAKIEAGRLALEMDEIAVETLVDAASTSIAGLLATSNKPVEFQVEVADDLPTLWGDQVRLNQVINNLTANAVKFTDKGHITLRAFADHSGRGDDGWICLEVEDTGVGIKEEDLGRIFERFQQADGSNARKVQGTGLGLAISRELVRMHGGNITAKSEVGQGSTFTVRLPARRPPIEGEVETAVEVSAEAAVEATVKAGKKSKGRKKER